MKLAIDLDDQGNVTLSGEDFTSLVREASRRKLSAARDRAYVGTEAWFKAGNRFELRNPEPKIYTYSIRSHTTPGLSYRVLVITDADTGAIKSISCSCPDYMYKIARGVVGHVCKHCVEAKCEHQSLHR